LVSETWVKAATAPQIKATRGLNCGFQLWLGASSVSGRRIDWVAAAGQGGQRIFIVPTLDLVAVVTAGNYYGNDHLASLVPQTVFDDCVLPSVGQAATALHIAGRPESSLHCRRAMRRAELRRCRNERRRGRWIGLRVPPAA
jgi:CubicO group peptidase (beta-lactamase class C family)